MQTEVKRFVATDCNGVIEALRRKKRDIPLLGPFSCVLVATVAGVEAFALKEMDKQGPTYRALIIARRDHGVHSLKGLSGKTFSFVDPSSASGQRVALEERAWSRVDRLSDGQRLLMH